MLLDRNNPNSIEVNPGDLMYWNGKPVTFLLSYEFQSVVRIRQEKEECLVPASSLETKEQFEERQKAADAAKRKRIAETEIKNYRDIIEASQKGCITTEDFVRKLLPRFAKSVEQRVKHARANGWIPALEPKVEIPKMEETSE